ncbi:peptidase family M49-domain-containing protein [Aspergillus egyptiacus]|nr:peptidase family M49-domain-containing protein [Aspergillus egyptiacus]
MLSRQESVAAFLGSITAINIYLLILSFHPIPNVIVDLNLETPYVILITALMAWLPTWMVCAALNRPFQLRSRTVQILLYLYLTAVPYSVALVMILYTTYLNIGVDGLQALEHYNFQSKTWGQAHFSIFKHLLQSGFGVVRVTHEPSTSTLTVHVDSTKFHSHGKPALADYLCRLHIWRCTADVSTCKEYYERLRVVDGMYEEWRQIVCSKPKPRWKFVQPNTVVRDDDVEVKLHEATNEGIIKSWVERGV